MPKSEKISPESSDSNLTVLINKDNTVKRNIDEEEVVTEDANIKFPGQDIITKENEDQFEVGLFDQQSNTSR